MLKMNSMLYMCVFNAYSQLCKINFSKAGNLEFNVISNEEKTCIFGKSLLEGNKYFYHGKKKSCFV